MDTSDVIRAWRDDDYREALTPSQQANLPESPIGEIDLSDADLEDIGGGTSWICSLEITVAASIAACYSLANGGTCPVGTFGCCQV